MATLREICEPVVESDVQEYRYNVVLKTKVGGLKLYLETNISAVSKRDAIQTVRGVWCKYSNDPYAIVIKQYYG